MLDAYTVRKAVPRILLAAIGINISIYLCVAMVDVTTILGKGVGDLLTSGFNANQQIEIAQQSFEGNIVLDGALLGAIVLYLFNLFITGGAIVGSLMLMIMLAVLIALAVLFTLVIRQALLVFLTVISPVAIACFVLPGTEKYFKKWLDLFVKTLMVYPIIAIMFAMSNIMGRILLQDASTTAFDPLSNLATIQSISMFAQSGSTGDTGQAVKLIAAIIVIYAPLVLIPFAFKLAGGAIAAIFNAAHGATAQRRDLMRKHNFERTQKARAANKEAILDGRRFKGGTSTNLRGRLNRGLQASAIVATGGAGINPGRFQSRMQASRATKDLQAFHKAKESAEARPVLVNDTLMNAALAGKQDEASARAYLEHQGGLTGRDLEEGVAIIRQARRAVGERGLAMAAAAALPGTKTAFTGENAEVEMIETAWAAARGDRALFGSIYDEQRKNAGNASRFDLMGYSFGGGLAVGDAMAKARATGNQAEIDRVREESSFNLQEDAFTHLTGGQIVGGHERSEERLLAHANRRLEVRAQAFRDAKASGDEARIAIADRELKQALAHSANMQEMTPNVGNANAVKLADSHLSHEIDLFGEGKISISEALRSDMVKSDPVFQQTKREMYEAWEQGQQRNRPATEATPLDPTKTS